MYTRNESRKGCDSKGVCFFFRGKMRTAWRSKRVVEIETADGVSDFFFHSELNCPLFWGSKSGHQSGELKHMFHTVMRGEGRLKN